MNEGRLPTHGCALSESEFKERMQLLEQNPNFASKTVRRGFSVPGTIHCESRVGAIRNLTGTYERISDNRRSLFQNSEKKQGKQQSCEKSAITTRSTAGLIQYAMKKKKEIKEARSLSGKGDKNDSGRKDSDGHENASPLRRKELIWTKFLEDEAPTEPIFSAENLGPVAGVLGNKDPFLLNRTGGAHVFSHKGKIVKKRVHEEEFIQTRDGDTLKLDLPVARSIVNERFRPLVVSLAHRILEGKTDCFRLLLGSNID